MPTCRVGRSLVIALVATGMLASSARASTGLAFVARHVGTGFNGFAGELAATADGTFLYAAQTNLNSMGRITVFRLDPFGQPERVQAIDGVVGGDPFQAAKVVAVSPDGAHVYTGGIREIVAWRRDPATGTLSRVQRLEHGVGGIDGLDGVGGLMPSPDGRHVYATAFFSGTVTVFARDATSGALTLVEQHRDGMGGITGLAGVRGPAISPDGHNVYAASGLDGSLAVFTRDDVTGQLTLLEEEPLGPGGDDVSRVRVAPDGGHVYVLRGGQLIFTRDTMTGAVTFAQLELLVRAWEFGPDPSIVFDLAAGVNARDVVTGSLTGLQQQPEEVVDFALSVAIAVRSDGRVAWLLERVGTILLMQRTEVRCSAAPLAGCRAPSRPAAGSVKIDRAHPRLVWKWLKGTATTLADFGDPLTADDYVLCVFDAGGGGQPRLEARLPADGPCGRGDCWRRSGATGFKYLDRAGTPEGITKALLKGGPAGGAKITVKGTGTWLPLPDTAFVTPMTVQLQRQGGDCWTASFSTPQIVTETIFQAKSD